MDLDKQVLDRVKRLPDEDLQKMLNADPSEYTPIALQAAMQELKSRGMAVSAAQKRPAKSDRVKVAEETELERSKNRVPTGCKVLGWYIAIASLILAYQYARQPSPDNFKIGMSVLSLVISFSAFAMLAGSRIGLAIVTAYTLLAGVGLLVGGYVMRHRFEVSSFFFVSVFFVLPGLYLLSQWRRFGDINKSSKHLEHSSDIAPGGVPISDVSDFSNAPASSWKCTACGEECEDQYIECTCCGKIRV